MKLFNVFSHLRSRLFGRQAVTSLVKSYALRIIAWQIAFYSRSQDIGIAWLFLTSRSILGVATLIFYHITRWKAKRNEQLTVPIRLSDPNENIEPVIPLCGPLVLDDMSGITEYSNEITPDINTLELDFQKPLQNYALRGKTIDKCYMTQIYPDSPWFLKIPYNALVPISDPSNNSIGFGIEPRALMVMSERRQYCINVGLDGPPLFYCSTCERHCLPRSKHCHDCDICVKSFDHHCPWFGVCISRNNMAVAIIYSLLEILHCGVIGLGIADDIMAARCISDSECYTSHYLVVMRILGFCIAVGGLIFATVISVQSIWVIIKLSSTWEEKREDKPGMLREKYDVLGKSNNWTTLIDPSNMGSWWHRKTHKHSILVRPDGVLFGMPCPLMHVVRNDNPEDVKWEELWLSRAMDD